MTLISSSYTLVGVSESWLFLIEKSLKLNDEIFGNKVSFDENNKLNYVEKKLFLFSILHYH